MITVYHLSTSRSERIVWLMEELGLEYKLELFQREPDGAAPDALRGIHPLGKPPVNRDGDTVLAESGAIVDYIVHRTEPIVSPYNRRPRTMRATSIGCILPKAA